MKQAVLILVTAAVILISGGCQCGYLQNTAGDPAGMNQTCKAPVQPVSDEYPQVEMEYTLDLNYATNF